MVIKIHISLLAGIALLGCVTSAEADPATEGKSVSIMPVSRIWDTETAWCSTASGADFILSSVTQQVGVKSLPIGWWATKTSPIAYYEEAKHTSVVLTCLPAKKFPELANAENITIWNISSSADSSVTQWIQAQVALYNMNLAGPAPEEIYARYGHKPPITIGDPGYVQFVKLGRTATRRELMGELLGYANALKLTPAFPFMDFAPLTMQAKNDHITIAFQLTQKDNCSDYGHEPDLHGCSDPNIEKPQQWIEMAVIASTSPNTADYYAKALKQAMLSTLGPPIQ